MVYRFRMISNEEKDFVRDIEICSEQTFFDLHKAIQEDLHYDSSQIASFFTTNQEWEKELEFTLFDMTDDESLSTVPMEKAELKDYISPRQRILYVFDFFNERAFFLELMDFNKELECIHYPRITNSEGFPPKQILMETIYPDSTLFDET